MPDCSVLYSLASTSVKHRLASCWSSPLGKSLVIIIAHPQFPMTPAHIVLRFPLTLPVHFSLILTSIASSLFTSILNVFPRPLPCPPRHPLPHALQCPPPYALITIYSPCLPFLPMLAHLAGLYFLCWDPFLLAP